MMTEKKMTRLPSSAMIFGTALGMSLASCTQVPATDSSKAQSPASNTSPQSTASETNDGPVDLTLIKVSIDGLKTDIDALSKQVGALDAKVSALSTGGKSAAAATPEQESKARETADQMKEHISKGEMVEAKQLMTQISSKYSNTNVYRSLQKRTAPELAVIGKKVGTSKVAQHIEHWFVDGTVSLDQGVTLIVFWESWCPHCKREMPELIELHNARSGQGLKILGLTRLTKSSTQEKVTAFVDEKGLNYPVAKENGKVAPLFNVSGIPAAAVVKDGEIIWRGHPNGLSDELWDKWL
jgi:thiol-disulfide isomerase/thioredoxin